MMINNKEVTIAEFKDEVLRNANRLIETIGLDFEYNEDIAYTYNSNAIEHYILSKIKTAMDDIRYFYGLEIGQLYYEDVIENELREWYTTEFLDYLVQGLDKNEEFDEITEKRLKDVAEKMVVSYFDKNRDNILNIKDITSILDDMWNKNADRIAIAARVKGKAENNNANADKGISNQPKVVNESHHDAINSQQNPKILNTQQQACQYQMSERGEQLKTLLEGIISIANRCDREYIKSILGPSALEFEITKAASNIKLFVDGYYDRIRMIPQDNYPELSRSEALVNIAINPDANDIPGFITTVNPDGTINSMSKGAVKISPSEFVSLKLFVNQTIQGRRIMIERNGIGQHECECGHHHHDASSESAAAKPIPVVKTEEVTSIPVNEEKQEDCQTLIPANKGENNKTQDEIKNIYPEITIIDEYLKSKGYTTGECKEEADKIVSIPVNDKKVMISYMEKTPVIILAKDATKIELGDYIPFNESNFDIIDIFLNGDEERYANRALACNINDKELQAVLDVSSVDEKAKILPKLRELFKSIDVPTGARYRLISEDNKVYTLLSDKESKFILSDEEPVESRILYSERGTKSTLVVDGKKISMNKKSKSKK